MRSALGGVEYILKRRSNRLLAVKGLAKEFKRKGLRQLKNSLIGCAWDGVDLNHITIIVLHWNLKLLRTFTAILSEEFHPSMFAICTLYVTQNLSMTQAILTNDFFLQRNCPNLQYPISWCRHWGLNLSPSVSEAVSINKATKRWHHDFFWTKLWTLIQFLTYFTDILQLYGISNRYLFDVYLR